MTDHRCDFGAGCQPPTILYGCNQFVLDIHGHPHTSIGGWFACEACAVHVDADDWQGLIDRAFSTGNMGGLHPEVRHSLIQWYAAFWRNRDGTKTLITQENLRDALALREELREER